MTILERAKEQVPEPTADPPALERDGTEPGDGAVVVDLRTSKERLWDPESMSALVDAISRSRTLAEKTDEILRRSAESIARARMRRFRGGDDRPE
jgi:hypothetical protein